jgi:hypothetical protein
VARLLSIFERTVHAQGSCYGTCGGYWVNITPSNPCAVGVGRSAFGAAGNLGENYCTGSVYTGYQGCTEWHRLRSDLQRYELQGPWLRWRRRLHWIRRVLLRGQRLLFPRHRREAVKTRPLITSAGRKWRPFRGRPSGGRADDGFPDLTDDRIIRSWDQVCVWGYTDPEHSMRVTTYVCAALPYLVFAQTSLPMPTATYFLVTDASFLQTSVLYLDAATGLLTPAAGNGTTGFSGDNGPAVNAQLNGAEGVALDSAGNLYIADSQNFRIRRVTNGVITTVVGSETAGFSGDGGPATSAQLNGSL